MKCATHADTETELRCGHCEKPICPKCMELFGYVCSPLCKAKADSHGLAVPTYAGQRSVVEARMWRRLAWIASAGVAVGLALSLWATRLVQTMLYELSARDTKTITLSILLLAAVALLAGYLPARRAARMDPNAILRDE